MKFLFIVCILSLNAFAADPIKLKGHYFEGEKKKGAFHKDNEIKKFEQKKSPLVVREKREDSFKKADLLEDIKKMDELDRDLLFYKAQTYSQTDLIKEFPDLKSDKLMKLKKEANSVQP